MSFARRFHHNDEETAPLSCITSYILIEATGVIQHLNTMIFIPSNHEKNGQQQQQSYSSVNFKRKRICCSCVGALSLTFLFLSITTKEVLSFSTTSSNNMHNSLKNIHYSTNLLLYNTKTKTKLFSAIKDDQVQEKEQQVKTKEPNNNKNDDEKSESKTPYLIARGDGSTGGGGLPMPKQMKNKDKPADAGDELVRPKVRL